MNDGGRAERKKEKDMAGTRDQTTVRRSTRGRGNVEEIFS
jgi:hypothetical protein